MTFSKQNLELRSAGQICVLQLYKLLTAEQANPWVLQLLHSVIKVSQILYSDEENRSPKQVLSLYNNAWLHMELCKDLIPTPRSISKRKMYGIYWHALTSHALQQYEIVCKKSINACRKWRKIIRPSEKSNGSDIQQASSSKYYFHSAIETTG